MSVSFPSPGDTGSSLLAMDVADGLATRGHDVRVMRYTSRRGQRRTHQWRAVTVEDVPRRDLVAFWRSTWRDRPDVLYSHSDIGLLAVSPLRAARIPLVHEVHQLSVLPERDGGLAHRMLVRGRNGAALAAARLAAAQIVLSHRVLEQLPRRR